MATNPTPDLSREPKPCKCCTLVRIDPEQVPSGLCSPCRQYRDELIAYLRPEKKKIQIPCPDNIPGCLVYHYREEDDQAARDFDEKTRRLK